MATVELSEVTKRFDDDVTAVDRLSLEVGDGELMVLVGPSGCGKSTALRLVAGLETVSAGEIRIDGAVVNHAPPQARDVAMVFQNYALYPHKTVRGNLDFPLRMMRMDREARRARIERTARLLELGPLLERRPRQLSGGQRQRVAMGRALVRDPRVFLMDEPLSNLDAKLRVEIRAEIAELVRRLGITTLYVTHDQVEAMTLGDRIAVLRDGRLQQVADARTLYDAPANVFVATFIGSPPMNVFRSRLVRERSEAGGSGGAGGSWSFTLGERTSIALPEAWRRDHERLGDRTHDELFIGLRPEAFVEAGAAPAGRRCRVTVHAVEALGHETIVYFELEDLEAPGASGPQPGAPLAARLPGGFDASPGDVIELGVDARRVHVFDAGGEAL